MKLWVIGSRGLLGSALIAAAKIPCIGSSHREADISDLNSLRAFAKRDRGITHIVNCAAYSLVDLSETHREEAYLSNAIGPENLSILAKEIGAHLIHISTDYVFPGDLHRPLTEQDPVGPLNYYGKTKLEGEQRVLKAMPSACVVRVSWLFGPGGKNFVSKMLQLLQEQKEIRLTNDQWGRPTYAPDFAQVLLQMLGRSGLYQFANSGVASKYDFGLAMYRQALELGFPVVAEAIQSVPGSTFPSPCKRPVYSAFDTSKIERELNITARHWELALREFMEEYAPAKTSC